MASKSNLEIATVKIPNKLSNLIVRDTVQLVCGVLKHLKYKGKWNLSFVNQVRNRSDNRFTVIRRDGTGIRIRTKPSANDSCWEIILSPPQGEVPQSVYNDLRAVHPTKLFVPRPHISEILELPESVTGEVGPQQRASLPVQTGYVRIRGEMLTRTTPKTCSFVKTDGFTCGAQPVDKIDNEYACKQHVVSPEWVALRSEIAGPPKQTKPKKAKEPSVIQGSNDVSKSAFSLRIDPLKVSSLSKDPIATGHGLVAAVIVMDNSTGSALRSEISRSIMNRLELEEYVKHSTNYKTSHSATRALLVSLCNQGLLSRCHGRTKSTSRRPTTESYIITPRGRQRLDDLKNILPGELIGQLFEGSKRNKGKDSTKIESVTDLATTDGIRSKVVAHREELSQLMIRHDDLVRSLDSSFDELALEGEHECSGIMAEIAGMRAQIASKDLERQNLLERIGELQDEMLGLETAISEKSSLKTKTEGEVADLRQQKIDQEEELRSIKARMKQLIS